MSGFAQEVGVPQCADDLTKLLMETVGLVGVRDVAAAGLDDPVIAIGGQVRLFGIGLRQGPRGPSGAQTLALDYLVTIRAPDPLEEHRLTADVLFAISERSDMEVLEQSSTAVCASLGLPAATGIVVQMLLSRDRAKQVAPPVREPLRVGLQVIKPAGIANDERLVGGGTVGIEGSTKGHGSDRDARSRIAGRAGRSVAPTEKPSGPGRRA